MQTIYNAIDFFSYRPSVGKEIYWDIQDGGKRPVAMGSSGDSDMFWMHMKQKRHVLLALTSFLLERGLTTK